MTTSTNSVRGRISPGGALRAARRASMKDSVQVPLPLLGTVTVNREELAFLAGVGVLVALDILEWPVAAILATGSVLSRDRSNKTLHAFGEALEEA